MAGLRNLFECQAVASGPVSASPSPTTQATMSSGIVERRAERVAQRIAELAAFVDASPAFLERRDWGCRRETKTA